MNTYDLFSRVAVAAAALLATWSDPTRANPYECLIQPNQTVEIRSAVEGVIEKVLVKRGDFVRAGQVLVQLESSAEASAAELARYRAEASGRLASATNRHDYATKKLNRS